jgi:hypothetical protein
MTIENTKITAEVKSVRDLNLYLQSGWILLLSYAKQKSDTHEPRFVVAWQNETEPAYPELLDEWEIHEMERQKYR